MVVRYRECVKSERDHISCHFGRRAERRVSVGLEVIGDYRLLIKYRKICIAYQSSEMFIGRCEIVALTAGYLFGDTVNRCVDKVVSRADDIYRRRLGWLFRFGTERFFLRFYFVLVYVYDCFYRFFRHRLCRCFRRSCGNGLRCDRHASGDIGTAAGQYHKCGNKY